jgi:hypothetical protein
LLLFLPASVGLSLTCFLCSLKTNIETLVMY